MRKNHQGKAGQMTCWVFHKELRAVEMLKEVMPNADFRSYVPAYLSQHGVSDAVSDLAEKIIDYLNRVPEHVIGVSNRDIAKALNVSNTNTRTWLDAVSKASESQYEWKKPKGAKSFLRAQALMTIVLNSPARNFTKSLRRSPAGLGCRNS
jgi:hypothetical protein